MSDFEFLRPIFLWLLPFFFLLLALCFRSGQLSTVWSQICSKELLPYVVTRGGRRQLVPLGLMAIAGGLAITALAGPSWGEREVPLIKPQSGLVIALDLSPVMDAADIKPSRLHRAIYKIKDLLAMRRGGQTALVVYSGNAFVVTPLTDDAAAIHALLPALDTAIMPSAGHRADLAIAKGVELLKQAGIPQGVVVLMTPSISDEELQNALKIASSDKITISVLGIGSAEGAPIPMPDGGFVKDGQGNLVVTTLGNKNLLQLANGANGTFAPIYLDDRDLRAIVQRLPENSGAAHQEESLMIQSKRDDRGYWLVLLALPLVALLFRRGTILAALLFFLPQSLPALSWIDLWQTQDQQAEEAFSLGQHQRAQELFQNNDWKGAATYRSGDYAAAAELFKQNQTADGYYNYGTAKAKMGDFEAALAAYDETLQMEPEHADAAYNKKLIEELMQQQQQQEKQEQPKKDEKENDPEQDKGSQQNQSDEKNKQNQQPESQEQPSTQEENKSDDGQADQQVEEQQAQNKPEDKEVAAEENDLEEDPNRQVDERWLQRVKDDPGGLLRRKFLYQYRQQGKN